MTTTMLRMSRRGLEAASVGASSFGIGWLVYAITHLRGWAAPMDDATLLVAFAAVLFGLLLQMAAMRTVYQDVTP